MATWNHKNPSHGYSMFVFVALYYYMFSYVQVHGSSSISSDKTVDLAKRKGAMKTIRSEHGDVIDCVDIYRQPAFDHPLLKNHTIQMKPSYYPRGMKLENFESELLLEHIECPEGTVPIVRARINNSTGAKYPRKKYLPQVAAPGHEYAQVSVVDGNYFGASAWVNVWKPATFNGEISISQFWILSGHGDQLNTMEAGWINAARDSETRLFSYWTNDNYQSTGCYNVDCPGFVQVSNKIMLDGRIKPLSTYGGKQFEININVHKDKQSGNWWLTVQNTDVGYWPGSIFTTLSDRAEAINWGGEITNSGTGERHTSTQMGSGHFPGEDYGKACYFRNIGFVDDSGAVRDAENLVPYVTRPECYDLHSGSGGNFATHFYFGGAGFSDKCK